MKPEPGPKVSAAGCVRAHFDLNVTATSTGTYDPGYVVVPHVDKTTSHYQISSNNTELKYIHSLLIKLFNYNNYNFSGWICSLSLEPNFPVHCTPTVYISSNKFY